MHMMKCLLLIFFCQFLIDLKWFEDGTFCISLISVCISKRLWSFKCRKQRPLLVVTEVLKCFLLQWGYISSEWVFYVDFLKVTQSQISFRGQWWTVLKYQVLVGQKSANVDIGYFHHYLTDEEAVTLRR